jgi:sugar-phosphatase
MTRDTDGIVQVAGAGKLLRSLPPERWAIVTSATRSMAEARLGQVGLPMPGVLISAEDVTAGKPDPAGYRLAARKLSFDVRRSIVLEDAPAGLGAGHAAGACVIAVASHLGPEALAGENWVADLTGFRVEAAGELGLSVRVNG